MIFTPLAAFAMKSELLAYITKINNRVVNDDAVKDSRIPSQSFIGSLLACLCKKSPYSRLLDRAEVKIGRQLDIVKFVKQQRKLRIATLATLSVP